MSSSHRNSQRRLYHQENAYFVTMVTFERQPFFTVEIFTELFIEDLVYAMAMMECTLYGYSVLPDHVHVLIQPEGRANYSEIIGAIKRNSARDINDLRRGTPVVRNESVLTKNIVSSVHDGDDSNRRLLQTSRESVLERNFLITRKNHPHLTYDVYKRHFMKLEELHSRFCSSDAPGMPQFRWQKSFHDHVIRHKRDFRNHLEYIFTNPVKHGLTDDPAQWKWGWIAKYS